MKDDSGHLDSLHEIRTMMERSSRFISLSGLSGVFAGIFAFAGIAYAYFSLGADVLLQPQNLSEDNLEFLIRVAAFVLLASLTAATVLSIRQARKRERQVWNLASKRLLINLLIPLFSGGIFILALLYYNLIGLIAPVMLIFYGLALINAGKYTLDDIRYLGIFQLILGLIALFNISNGVIYWIIGFGVLHIVYGLVMYKKYER